LAGRLRRWTTEAAVEGAGSFSEHAKDSVTRKPASLSQTELAR
jgi:hypothetical protein